MAVSQGGPTGEYPHNQAVAGMTSENMQQAHGGRNALWILLTLLIGFAGSFISLQAGLPAPALIGSTIAVSVSSIFRLPTRMVSWLRNCGFAVIGCSLGSGVSSDIWQQAARWPVSLIILVVVMAFIFLTSSQVLFRFFGLSKETALLASSPGALTYALAIAATGIGDLQAVVVIQSVRLLGITTLLPLILDVMGFSSVGSTIAAMPIPWLFTALLYLLTLIAGKIFVHFRFPAAYLIGGVLVSGLFHVLGVVHGRPQPAFLFIGFVITGCVVGSRFSTISLVDLRRLAFAAMTIFFLSSLLAALCAWPASLVLGIPFGQVWVAYAPGGVEAMAAMAMALGYDTTFVAFHHLMRIFLLLGGLPLLINLCVKRPGRDTPQKNKDVNGSQVS